MPKIKQVGKVDSENGAVIIKEIKPIKGEQEESKIDFAAPHSAYRHFKTGKFAKDLPALCDLCSLGNNKSAHGTNQCEMYEPGAICRVREDLTEWINKFDTKKPEHLREIIDQNIKYVMQEVSFAKFLTAMQDNSGPNPYMNTQLNILIKLVKLQHELIPDISKTAIKAENAIDGSFLAQIFNMKGK